MVSFVFLLNFVVVVVVLNNRKNISVLQGSTHQKKYIDELSNEEDKLLSLYETVKDLKAAKTKLALTGTEQATSIDYEKDLVD